MKERYLRKIRQEEAAIENLDSEIKDMKQEIFDIKVKNSDAIDWHSSKCKPIVRAANRKMTMMYLGSKTENIKLIDQITEWTKLETFLKKKVGMALIFFWFSHFSNLSYYGWSIFWFWFNLFFWEVQSQVDLMISIKYFFYYEVKRLFDIFFILTESILLDFLFGLKKNFIIETDHPTCLFNVIFK